MLAGNGLRWRRWAWATDLPFAGQALDRGPDGPVGRAPAEDQQVALLRPEDLERRDVVGDARDLGRAQGLHPVVVVRVVADVAGDVGLLQPADPVLEAGRAGDGPRPRQRLGVALVRTEGRRVGRVRDADRGQVRERRDLPRLRAGGQERVRQVDDRGHVLEREPARPRWRSRSTRRAWPGRRSGSANPSCARTSPGAGPPARSWSASRSTGRPAGRR